MGSRGRTTFQKRQKEMARKDKQQRKADRRAQKKLDGPDPQQTVFEDVELPSEQEQEPGSEPQEI